MWTITVYMPLKGGIRYGGWNLTLMTRMENNGCLVNELVGQLRGGYRCCCCYGACYSGGGIVHGLGLV